MAEKTDLHANEWEHLEWSTKDMTLASLAWLFDYATGEAEAAVGWYQRKKIPKKRGAVVIRAISVVIATVAGILPLMSQLAGASIIPPALASVALALGVALLALDKYFGFSRAWMRYVTTDLRIQQLLNEFRFDWETARIGYEATDPDVEGTRAMVKLLRGFVSSLRTAIRDETNEWVRDFTTSLGELEKYLKQTDE